MVHMKAKNLALAVAMIVGGSVFFTSCMERDRYNTYPNNNYPNNNNNTSSTTFDEEFNGSDLYGWTFSDAADSAYASIANGTYQYVDYSKVKSNMSVVSTNINTAGNFTIQTKIKADNMMGLIFGASSTDNGYAFYVDSAGYYSLYREGAGTTASTPIIPSTQDTTYALKKDWNTLEVDQTNGTWTGYINGTLVFTMAARTIYGSSFGFKVLPTTIGYADYLTVKND